jgi:hypothetical protein
MAARTGGELKNEPSFEDPETADALEPNAAHRIRSAAGN